MSEDKILKINKRSFIIVVAVLVATMILAYVLTFVIGDGYSFWKFLGSPLLVLGSPDGINIIVISLFILILGGAFNVMDKTGGIKAIISALINRFQKRKYLLMYSITLFFMLFGALFGIFEESITLLPIIIMLALSLGWDTFTGLGMCLLAAGFGFSTALTNPFSIGLGSEALGIGMLNGIWFRLIIFVIMYFLLIGYLTLHVKQIEKNPEKSISFESDNKKRENLNLENEEIGKYDKRVLWTYTSFFIFVLLAVIVCTSIPAISGYVIPILAVIFLFGIFICSWIIKAGFIKSFLNFLSGVLAMSPAIVMMLLAGSVKFILVDANTMETITSSISNSLSQTNGFTTVLLIYGFILFIQFFIGSASAKVILIIPIISEVIASLAVSKEIALLAFVFGDGYTDLIYPTNPVLLIALGIAGISYVKWFKKTWLLQLVILVLTVGFLGIAYLIGY